MNIPILIPYFAYCKYTLTFDSMKVSVIALDDGGEVYETETDIVLEDPPISIKVNVEMRRTYGSPQRRVSFGFNYIQMWTRHVK